MTVNISSVKSQNDLTVQISIPGNDPIKNIIYLDNLTPLLQRFNQIFNQFYLGFIPRIDAMLFPLFVFISVIFFTSRMAGNSEIVAIFWKEKSILKN